MHRTEKQIINCFKAISILTRGTTIKDLAVRLDVSLKTAYRYLELLQNVGFLFEQKSDHVYKLINSSDHKYLTISFTRQEVDVIMKTIQEDAPLYKSIRDKLYIHSDILSFPISSRLQILVAISGYWIRPSRTKNGCIYANILRLIPITRRTTR